jgi:hypothetical protein
MQRNATAISSVAFLDELGNVLLLSDTDDIEPRIERTTLLILVAFLVGIAMFMPLSPLPPLNKR